jgi:hypothetical protein
MNWLLAIPAGCFVTAASILSYCLCSIAGNSDDKMRYLLEQSERENPSPYTLDEGGQERAREW